MGTTQHVHSLSGVVGNPRQVVSTERLAATPAEAFFFLVRARHEVRNPATCCSGYQPTFSALRIEAGKGSPVCGRLRGPRIADALTRAAAFTIDAPCAAKALRRSSSSGVHRRTIVRIQRIPMMAHRPFLSETLTERSVAVCTKVNIGRLAARPMEETPRKHDNNLIFLNEIIGQVATYLLRRQGAPPHRTGRRSHKSRLQCGAVRPPTRHQLDRRYTSQKT
jgi:hypothetical protein